jgi:hypothetical protein
MVEIQHLISQSQFIEIYRVWTNKNFINTKNKQGGYEYSKDQFRIADNSELVNTRYIKNAKHETLTRHATKLFDQRIHGQIAGTIREIDYDKPLAHVDVLQLVEVHGDQSERVTCILAKDLKRYLVLIKLLNAQD